MKPERRQEQQRSGCSKSAVFLAACLVLCFTAIAPRISVSQQLQQSTRKSPPSPVFSRFSPDVIVGGSEPTIIQLRGTGLKILSSLDILDCDRSRTKLRVDSTRPAALFVTIPAWLLLKPCVLRVVSTEGVYFNVPLGVADPQLAKLKPPPYSSPAEGLHWGGWFNHLMVSGDVDISSDGEAVSVRVDSPEIHYVFVLGKHDVTLFHINPLKSPVPDPSVGGGEAFDLFLPGVEVTDVKWSGDDEEFWIGTLSKDGTKVVDRRLLSSMADEPSGALDND
jgi:hypothetical protein